MRYPDETDLEILELLQSNARRPYSDIAEAVDLSAPAVSDRVARLEEQGIIRRFTVDVDRSQLQSGIPIAVRLGLAADGPDIASVREALLGHGAVEHVFTTATGDLEFVARLPDPDVASWIGGIVGDDAIGAVEVTLLSRVEWSPEIGGAGFALECVECGNTVDAEGNSRRLDGRLYHFCCPSCEELFTERFERLSQGAA